MTAPTVTTRTMRPPFFITLRYDAPMPVVSHRALLPVPLERLHENAVNLANACADEFGVDSPEARERRAMADALATLLALDGVK